MITLDKPPVETFEYRQAHKTLETLTAHQWGDGWTAVLHYPAYDQWVTLDFWESAHGTIMLSINGGVALDGIDAADRFGSTFDETWVRRFCGYPGPIAETYARQEKI